MIDAPWIPPVVLLLSMLLPAPQGLKAAQVEGLYQAEVRVEGQSSEQRNQAIRAALAQVLIKVSGNPAVTSRKPLLEAIRNAPHYVQQYSYLRVPANEAEELPEQSDSEPPRLLQVSFDARAVDQLLREQGLPVWGANRPSILVWIGVEQKGRRRLLPLEQGDPVRTALERAARERGLPLLFPLMDLEDRGRMQISDLWGGFEEKVQDASRRYATDLILIGRITRVAKALWRGRWTLFQRERNGNWESEAKSDSGLVAGAVQHVADLLADRFVPLEGENASSELKLKVDGVDNLEQYLAVKRLLDSQSSIRQAVVDVIDPGAVTFRLQTRGSLEALEQGLGLGGLIEPVADTASDQLPGTAVGVSAPPGTASRQVDLGYRIR